MRASFSIGLHTRDINILMIIINHFNVGNLYSNNQATFVFEIATLTGIKTSLIPLFNEYDLNNIKKLDFLDFKEIISLIYKGEHLTFSGFNTIR